MSVQRIDLPATSVDECQGVTVDGLWDLVRAAGNLVIDAINDVFRWLYSMVDDHMEVIGGILGFSVGGIVGGVVGYFAGGALEDLINDRINTAFDRVEAAWHTLWNGVLDLVQQIWGDPAELAINWTHYNSSVAELSGIADAILAVKNEVDTYWDGPAAEVYLAECDAQITATEKMKDFSASMANLSSDGAIDVLTGWLWLPLQLREVTVAVLGVIAGAFDAGKLILAEAGPIIEFVNVGLEFVIAAEDELIERFEASARTAAALVTETADVQGLPGGNWPSTGQQNVFGEPRNWDAAEVY